MKGISSIIAAVMIIAISVSAVAIALSVGSPAIEKSKEILILNQGKENLKVIDETINQVLQEGDGSSRKIGLTVTGGSYSISGNTVRFTMETKQQIIASGIAGSDDIVFVEASDGMINAYIDYPFDFVGEKTIEKGVHDLVIANRNGQIEIV